MIIGPTKAIGPTSAYSSVAIAFGPFRFQDGQLVSKPLTLIPDRFVAHYYTIDCVTLCPTLIGRIELG